MSIANLSPRDARELLHSGREVAFLDVREAADFGDGHALFAVPCPYSRLEVSAIALVPRADVPILLIDAGDGIAERAARRLAACGYRDLRIITGGMPAWSRAGYGVFAGVNVPSKTLGELLEHAHHPQTIDAGTLHAWRSEQRVFHFFDARPSGEYAKMRIPGARCLPNGELAHRLDSVVHDDITPIVITCAGRTRGIIGALGLAAAGIRNPVVALENGTQGWALAGFALDRGATAEPFPVLDVQARDASRRRADDLAAKSGISCISPEQASAMLTEPGRTTFLFDLRSADERLERPCSGAAAMLAGQLVQATDQYVGVRHARLILLDDTGLRGALSALWLRALGFEAHVLALDAHAGQIAFAARESGLRMPGPPSPISAAEALRLVARSDVALIDIRNSQHWESAHLAGACWEIRPRLVSSLPSGTREAILFTTEAAVAAAASLDLHEAGIAVRWLNLDLEDCRRAGWTIERSGAPMNKESAVDRVWFVHDRHDGNREASLQYLAWETGLIDQLDEQERSEFLDVELRR